MNELVGFLMDECCLGFDANIKEIKVAPLKKPVKTVFY